MNFRISDSLPNQITRYLTEQIVRGHIKPGEWIREAHIAKALGVSRIPIREALQSLQKNRLVELIPRQGARVTPLSKQYIRWLYEILQVLYSLILRQVILNSDEDRIRRLDAALEKIESLSPDRDEDAYYDMRFEYAMICLEVNDNQLIKEIIMDLVPSIMRVQHMALRQRVINIEGTLTHLRKINDSIKKRNVKQGVKAVSELLASDMEFALNIIQD
ncbi:MAG TPA: GntR family transcriptional regulator [Desulfomonilia bacterium]